MIVKSDVVFGGQNLAQDFIGIKEMLEVGAGEVLVGVSVQIGFHRKKIPPVGAMPNPDFSPIGEECPSPGKLGGDYTVAHVNPVFPQEEAAPPAFPPP